METCPDGQFGNDTTRNCQQCELTHSSIVYCDSSLFSVVAGDYTIALNATVYYVEIRSDHPLNTPVFRIRAFFRSTAGFQAASLGLSQTGQINNLFEFEGGSNDTISISIGDFVSVGGQNVFDTTINLIREPDSEFTKMNYPVDLDMDINLVALFSPNIAPQVISKGAGSIHLAPGEKILHLHACVPKLYYHRSL